MAAVAAKLLDQLITATDKLHRLERHSGQVAFCHTSECTRTLELMTEYDRARRHCGQNEPHGGHVWQQHGKDAYCIGVPA